MNYDAWSCINLIKKAIFNTYINTFSFHIVSVWTGTILGMRDVTETDKTTLMNSRPQSGKWSVFKQQTGNWLVSLNSIFC